MPIQATAVTRLGIAGGIWSRLGGDYSNKAASPPTFTGTIPNITGSFGASNIVTDLSGYFSGATSYSIAPTVEAGWTFDTGTGILTVDTDVAATFGTYIVTGTNAAGSDASNAFSVIISAVSTAATGGWWHFQYEQEQLRQEAAAKKRKEKKEKARLIKNKLDRELALAFRAKEANDEKTADLKRLTALANEYREGIAAENANIAQSIDDAVLIGTYSRMQKLARELGEIAEERQFLMLATRIILESQ